MLPCRLTETCTKEHLPDACAHEYHIFGTRDPTAATAKLALLIFMLIVNVGIIMAIKCLYYGAILPIPAKLLLVLTHTS